MRIIHHSPFAGEIKRNVGGIVGDVRVVDGQVADVEDGHGVWEGENDVVGMVRFDLVKASLLVGHHLWSGE